MPGRSWSRRWIWLPAQGGQRLPIASEALIGLGELWREWNDLESAAATAWKRGIMLASSGAHLAAFDAYFPLARVRVAQGDSAGAREAIETARQIALKSEATEVDDLVSDLQQARFALTQGEVARALRWAEGRGLLANVPSCQALTRTSLENNIDRSLRKYERLVLARLLLSQGRAPEAIVLLDSLLAHCAGQLGRVDLIIQIQILRALACQSEGLDARGLDALAEALSLAEPGGFVRIFVDEGPPLARLLRQAASRGMSPAYVASLLAAFDGLEPVGAAAGAQGIPSQPLIEALSEREMEVLRLLATGLSNPEIAQELYVAVSTVRSHCKSIYGKLDVHRRWDAVQRAGNLVCSRSVLFLQQRGER